MLQQSCDALQKWLNKRMELVQIRAAAFTKAMVEYRIAEKRAYQQYLADCKLESNSDAQTQYPCT